MKFTKEEKMAFAKSSTQLLTKTFTQAYADRKAKAELMFHSECGTQYMSHAFVQLLEDFGVEQSFPGQRAPMTMQSQKRSFPFSKRKNYTAGIIRRR